MEVEILTDAEAVAARAAQWLAERARAAVRNRGQFTLAVSGGTTPWEMLKRLAAEDVPWAGVHLFQVDERIAPPGDADRNLTHLLASLQSAAIPPENIHAMPVNADPLDLAAKDYARELESFAGSPPVLDVIHLGLGSDGHTASLVPGDPVLAEQTADVALTGIYQGRRRMTLTYPVLNRARNILWLATGASKQEMLARLRAGDPTIPAGRVNSSNGTILADDSAWYGAK